MNYYINNTDTDMADNTSFNQKQTINVLVMTGPDSNSIEAYKQNEEGKDIYKGYGLDVFRQLTQKGTNLDDKYTFNINYAPTTKSYDKTIDEVYQGKYDMVIGNYTQTYKRELKVNFTIPLLVDGISVMHMTKQSVIIDHIGHSFITMIKPILILIFVGIIIGIFISIFDSGRMKLTRISGAHKDYKFRLRSILTGVSTMFGEMGFMSENSSKTIKGLFISIIAMTIATVWILFMQAYLTTELIDKKSKENIDMYLHKDGKPILGLKGYNEASTLEQMGGNILFYDNDETMNDLIDIYKKDPSKYNGVVFSYTDLYNHVLNDPSIEMTTGFNKVLTGFIVNEQKTIFLMDFNNSIMAHKESGELEHICNSYISGTENLDVCFLVEGK